MAEGRGPEAPPVAERPGPAGSGAAERRSPPAPARHFGDRLAEAVAARRSQVVLGLDPDPLRLWPEALAAGERAAGSPAERAAAAVRAHCLALIAAAGPACVAAKPQLACFERLGAPGWAVLGDVVAAARQAGLLVIGDGKRGDVPVTAAAYAQALLGSTPTPFGDVPGLGLDAITANPLLGRDALAPLLEAAAAAGAGVLVLARTSNPGAADLQDLPLAPGGEPVHERLAALVDELGAPRVGVAGLADVGAVVGATAPQHLARLRARMPVAPLLLPGVGAQGGRVEDLAAAWAPGRAGALVTASRTIARAADERGGDPATAARAAAEELRALAWRISEPPPARV